jgi:hypothetical protein
LPAFGLDPFVVLTEAGLLAEMDGVGVEVSDAATATVPAPPMIAALAPTTAMVFHMLCSLARLLAGGAPLAIL